MIRRITIVVFFLAVFVTVSTGLAERGLWTFDSDPGFQERQDGTNPNFDWYIYDGELFVTMTREAATERIYVPLVATYNHTNMFRVKARFAVLHGAPTTVVASMIAGFFDVDDHNCSGTNDHAGLNMEGFNSYPLAWGGGQHWHDGPEYGVDTHTWYVAEMDYSGSAADWGATLYTGDGLTVLKSWRKSGTSGMDNGVNVFGFGNEDRSQDDAVQSVVFDWVSWSINEELLPDPPPPPTSERGIWTFDYVSPMFQEKTTSDPHYGWSVADGILDCTMSRQAECQRLYLPLANGGGGDNDIFRIRARFQVTDAQEASVLLGFFDDADGNIVTDDRVFAEIYRNTDFSSGYCGSAYDHGSTTITTGAWYVYEMEARPGDPTFRVTLYDDDMTELATVTPAAGGTDDGLDVVGLGNYDNSASSAFETVSFDWISWAISDELMPGPPAGSGPTVAPQIRDCFVYLSDYGWTGGQFSLTLWNEQVSQLAEYAHERLALKTIGVSAYDRPEDYGVAVFTDEFNPIKDLIDTFHAKGIKVLSMMYPFNKMTGYPDSQQYEFKDELGGTISNDMAHYCPRYPEVRQSSVNQCLELLSLGYDGIIFDEVLGMPDEGCYCSHCSSAWGQSQKSWKEFRYEPVDAFLQEVNLAVRNQYPESLLTVFARKATWRWVDWEGGLEYLRTYEYVAQNWPFWIQQGWIDYANLQVTLQSVSEFNGLIALAAEVANPHDVVVCMYPEYTDNPTDVFDVVEDIWEQGFRGPSFFCWHVIDDKADPESWWWNLSRGYKIGLLGDFNGDATIDMADYTELAAHWLEGGIYIYDANNDNVVDLNDLADFAGYWLCQN